MRIHKQIKQSLFTFFIMMLVPISIFANETGFTQAEIQSMQSTTQKQLNSEAIQRWVKTIQQYNPSQPTADNTPVKTRRSDLMIFVSFSMSDGSLGRYLSAGKKIKASLVLRGLLNNSFTDTARKIHEVIQNTQGGFSIDPIAYEKLHINKVPAIVLFNQAGLICLNTQRCTPNPSDYDIIYGNVTLEYALSQFAGDKSAISESAKNLLKQLRGNIHV